MSESIPVGGDSDLTFPGRFLALGLSSFPLEGVARQAMSGIDSPWMGIDSGIAKLDSPESILDSISAHPY